MAEVGAVTVPVRLAVEEVPLLTVESGKRYVMEFDDGYSAEEALSVAQEFHRATGASVVVLHGGIRLLRDTEAQS